MDLISLTAPVAVIPRLAFGRNGVEIGNRGLLFEAPNAYFSLVALRSFSEGLFPAGPLGATPLVFKTGGTKVSPPVLLTKRSFGLRASTTKEYVWGFRATWIPSCDSQGPELIERKRVSVGNYG